VKHAWSLPRIYPILDMELLAGRGIAPSVAAEAFLEGGARILQLRQKAFFSRDVFREAERIGRMCREAGAILVLNDRADFARLLNAGLHIGQDDLPPLAAREIIGPNALMGFSTHNDDQMREAQKEPVDYFAFGPVFATGTKAKPDPITGTEGLRGARALTAKPLVAIGGITLENAGACFEAGADSLAIISGMIPEDAEKAGLRARMTEWLQASVMLHKWPRLR
jgi:thiamine-phosphate pyrophosphorylase